MISHAVYSHNPKGKGFLRFARNDKKLILNPIMASIFSKIIA
jgi:hypothetical protein